MQGSQSYVGATPSYVIWNLLQRYTRPGDLIVDPMCGSGTTLDVAADLDRRGRGFDVTPARPDVERADARKLPLRAGTADFAFVDPPYGDHIHYSDAPNCIGNLSAYDEAYYDAMDGVLQEMHRVLKNRRYMAVYVCDFYNKKHGFAALGARLMGQMAQFFTLVDHVCIVRHNKSLKRTNWHTAAVRDNFFLRGFNHLLIGKKVAPEE